MFGKELPGFGYLMSAKKGGGAPAAHSCTGRATCNQPSARGLSAMPAARRAELQKVWKELTEPGELEEPEEEEEVADDEDAFEL